MTSMGRARRWVEIVNETGEFRGASPVEEAHSAPGRLHRAFSVLLYDATFQVLVQRRADDKSRFPGLWANTCCSHPGPGEDLEESARRRVRSELGMNVGRLSEAGTFTYRATDPVTGSVEHEYDHVLVGRAAGEPLVDPAEVAEWRWRDPAWLRADLRTRPAAYAPWFAPVLDIAEAAPPAPEGGGEPA
jgi:isopentenyl-diphosphate delta-isomerase